MHFRVFCPVVWKQGSNEQFSVPRCLQLVEENLGQGLEVYRVLSKSVGDPGREMLPCGSPDGNDFQQEILE